MKHKINTNCLAGMKCPVCASSGPFKMPILTIAVVSDDGTEDIVGDVDFVKESKTTCQKCMYVGPASEFDAEEHYVNRGGNHCPYCNAGEEHLETETPIQADGANAWEEIRCGRCGAGWQALYKLVGIGNFPDDDFVLNHNEILENKDEI